MNLSQLNCLTDCKALCCKDQELSFPFSARETEFLRNNDSVLETKETSVGVLYRLVKCTFLVNNMCLIHDIPNQPGCCRDTKPGSSTCLSVRKRMKM
jgi:hypothetical protein